uniref:Condensin complex subunit 1 C-terminal domain-containing protein n=1 Tax=Trichuris muris TaxID=70415 RepID=A0A5S6QVU9_TRIMR
MKRAYLDALSGTASKRTKFKSEPSDDLPESGDLCGHGVKRPLDDQVSPCLAMETVVSPQGAECTVKSALKALSAGQSFEDSAELVRSLDDLLERDILSLEIIENAIDALLRQAAEIDEEMWPSYRVEHIYSLLCKFADHSTCATPLWRNLWDALERCLRNSSLCSTRLCCLLSLTHLAIRRAIWLGQRGSTADASPNDVQKSIETLLAKHTADYDHRIRIKALDCLAKVQQFGFPLMFDNYNRICELVSDQNGSVRLRAYRLVANYATLYPDSNCQSVKLRLVDHAFSKICYAMQDISVSNRVEAAKLLGQFRGVSDKFLEQTLDKKLLKQMKIMRDCSVDFQSNEWATGRMFGADAPAELLDGSYVPLIDSEACGAFIAGLEDEHMDVRNASIDSVSSLAMENKEFAQKCLEFLVDMFNDEIDEVRLNAIKHLARLCSFVTIGDEQLRSIYNGLVDSSPDGREAIREVLACCRFENSLCLELTLNALTNNLSRNPEDKWSVWNCTKQLGSRLSGLVLPLTCELLGLHPYYETAEPKLNDPCYIAKLILVLNAAKHCPTIMSLFLNCTWNHYDYLRVNCPTLVPSLQRPGFLPLSVDPALLQSSESQRFEQCIEQAEQSLKQACAASADERRQLFKAVAWDLQLLSNEERDSSGICECTLHCVRLVAKLEEIIQHFYQSCFLDSMISEAAAEVFKMAIQLALVWKGGEQLSRFTSEVQLRTAFFLAVVLDFFRGDEEKVHESDSPLLPPVHTLIAYALRLNAPSLEIFAPFVNVHTDTSTVQWNVGLRKVVETMKEKPLHPTVIRESVVRLSAVITEPSDNANVIYRFAGALVLAVPLAANLYGFSMDDLSLVRIRLVYPDTTVKLFKPRKKDFADFLPAFIRLRTNVLLTAPAWTDPAPVEMSVILLAHQRLLWNDKMQSFAISNSVRVRIFPKLI